MTRIVAALLLAALTALPALAKDKEPYVWEKIQTVDLTQREIITYSNAYIAEKFGSGKEVVELNDPDLGKLVGTVILMNEDAKLLHAFHGIRGRLIIDAKDGRIRIQMHNIVATDSKGVKAAWGEIESANRYRIEPMAVKVLDKFATDLQTYLANARANSDW
ncbi:DUF4468 domain-containing protein [Luteimonas arsenica]|uniref:DUF4468 domain-containing protein n=1 Tax=Luteimonas arsenica TaxID=1586242 RepID=UPI001054323C|nr:DUF4468 domain-containing protein [Luteimonas arsenica]